MGISPLLLLSLDVIKRSTIVVCLPLYLGRSSPARSALIVPTALSHACALLSCLGADAWPSVQVRLVFAPFGLVCVSLWTGNLF